MSRLISGDSSKQSFASGGDFQLFGWSGFRGQIPILDAMAYSTAISDKKQRITYSECAHLRFGSLSTYTQVILFARQRPQVGLEPSHRRFLGRIDQLRQMSRHNIRWKPTAADSTNMPYFSVCGRTTRCGRAADGGGPPSYSCFGLWFGPRMVPTPGTTRRIRVHCRTHQSATISFRNAFVRIRLEVLIRTG
jgi:hypothetical protein